MQAIHQIVVGIATEGSPPVCRPSAHDAFRHALLLASRTGATVTAVTTTELPYESESLRAVEEEPVYPQLQQIHRELADEASALGVRVHSHVAPGHAGTELIRTVLRTGAQMLFVGPGKGGPLRQSLFGSTALEVLRKAPCPVWISRISDNTPKIDVILAADDFSDSGERVLDLAVGLAQALGAGLLAMHALSTDENLPGARLSEPELVAHREQVHRAAEETLARRLSQTDYRTLARGSQILVRHNLPEIAIPDAAQEHAVDLVVLGTEARGGLTGLLIGNTAERVMANLACSIVAIKPDSFVCPIAPES